MEIRVFANGVVRWPGGWARAALGRGGVLREKREGDGGTPVGLFPLRRVLYRADRLVDPPATGLPVDAIDPDLGWCDDPSHPAYNRPVRLPFAASHERLWRDDEVYDLLAVIGYNDDPPVPGLGSAIFLHVAREDFSPTEGCVALPADHLAALLAAAGPADQLRIEDVPS